MLLHTFVYCFLNVVGGEVAKASLTHLSRFVPEAAALVVSNVKIQLLWPPTPPLIKKPSLILTAQACAHVHESNSDDGLSVFAVQFLPTLLAISNKYRCKQIPKRMNSCLMFDHGDRMLVPVTAEGKVELNCFHWVPFVQAQWVYNVSIHFIRKRVDLYAEEMSSDRGTFQFMQKAWFVIYSCTRNKHTFCEPVERNTLWV